MSFKPRRRRARALDIVRKRPGMYVGDVSDGTGLHHLLWEVVANGVDEHVVGRCRQIELVLHADGSVTVADDGRGISVSQDGHGRRFAERCLTQLHLTATEDGHVPHVHVGLLGVGLGPVNALCEWLRLEVVRGGGKWSMRCARGAVVEPLRRVGAASGSGTRIR